MKWSWLGFNIGGFVGAAMGSVFFMFLFGTADWSKVILGGAGVGIALGALLGFAIGFSADPEDDPQS